MTVKDATVSAEPRPTGPRSPKPAKLRPRSPDCPAGRPSPKQAARKPTKAVIAKRAALRTQARLLYVTSQKAPTHGELAAALGTNTAQIAQWSAKEGWVEERAQFLEKFTEEVKKQLGSALVQERLEEIRRLRKLDALAMSHLESAELKPASWEATARVKIAIGERIDALGSSVGKELGLTNGEPAQATGATYSDDEIEAIAKEVLAKRRQAALPAGAETGPAIAGPTIDVPVQEAPAGQTTETETETETVTENQDGGKGMEAQAREQSRRNEPARAEAPGGPDSTQ